MPEARARISLTINVPIILAIIGQAVLLLVAGTTWKSSVDSTMSILDRRIAVLEETAKNNTVLIERVKGVEVNVEVLKEQGQNIENKIDKLIDRGSHR